MKLINNLIPVVKVITTGLIFFLTACGGENFNSAPLTSQLIERECIDNNQNSRCETTELENYTTKTSDTKSLSSDGNSTRLLETVNSLTGKQTLVLKAPTSSAQTDALTTLLWHELYHNPSVNNIDQAKNYLAEKLGIIWPLNAQISSVYQQQEALAREHLGQAQWLYSTDYAITATIEAMILNRSIDSPADISLINQEILPLVLTGHYISEKEILNWGFSNQQSGVTLVHAERTLSQLNIATNGQLIFRQSLNLSPGTEAILNDSSTAEDDSNSKFKVLPSANMTDNTGNKVDAFASATTSAPAPAPAPAPNLPSTPDSQPTQPRSLTPAGEVHSVHLNSDNRTGLFLTRDTNQQATAPRACNNNITSHGIFKFDHYLTNNNKTPVIAACSQMSLEKFDVSQDGKQLLAWDNAARRIYLLDSSTMREATNYYLQLNSNLLLMKLNPQADYALITEEQGRKSYIVRLADMQVMTDFSFAGNQVQGIKWLDAGNKLLISSHNEWQLWDTRLAYNPIRLDQGELKGEGPVTFNIDGSLYARLKNNTLSIFRQPDNQLLAQKEEVDHFEWHGNQIVIQQNNQIKNLALYANTNHPIQLVSAALTNSLIAANNINLKNIEQDLILPANANELIDLNLKELEELIINWSVSSELENHINYSGREQGRIIQTTTPKNGILTATVNSYFRGEAIRWTRDFEITIKANNSL